MAARFDPGIAPRPEHHHRDVGAGRARAAVFGVSDGLVSNVGLILGVVAGDASAKVVRLAGLAGLIAGAVSMAAGEYNSMQVQRELFERELDLERREIRRNPNVETVELTQIYQARGISADQAREMAPAVMSDPEQALQAHAREELGIDPKALGSPMGAARWSFGGFALGALVPLLPWFFIDHGPAVGLTLAIALVASIVIGVVTARFTNRSWRLTILRQATVAAVAVVITFGVCQLAGVNGV